ncbi:MAG TPA: Arc family DNA-binding protein [Gammaproteobacteria bacterium]|nr:Arc family DNA-binding protein [Gammaproteobacteria bacterium]
MAMMTVRNIPDEIHRALRVRAAMHGRSTEAEVRAILEESVKAEGRLKLGSMLARIGRQAEVTDEDIESIEKIRDKTPAKPVGFN